METRRKEEGCEATRAWGEEDEKRIVVWRRKRRKEEGKKAKLKIVAAHDTRSIDLTYIFFLRVSSTLPVQYGIWPKKKKI